MKVRDMFTGLLFLGVLLGPALRGQCDEAHTEKRPKTVAIGEKVPNSHSLRDLRGNLRALHDFKGNKVFVLAFVAAECPVSNLALPELIPIEKAYRGKSVQFLAVYPNDGEDLDEIADHAYDRDVPFPVLRDAGQKLADALGVTRVPTTVVLDGDYRLCYRGRIDDCTSVAARRPVATRDDLVRAIEEVLAGKPVSVPETEADGCLLGRERKITGDARVTYSEHVARVLQARCQVCHRPGQAAPFALLGYEDAVKHGPMIKEVVRERRMPPWHADSRYGHFANDRRLTREEIDVLCAWVDQGMTKGDPSLLPPPVAWTGGWTLGKPDIVLEAPEAFEVPATGVLPYKNWIIETNFTEDKWVQMAECRPGAPGVIHHIAVYVMKKDQHRSVDENGGISILVGWAPGDLGLVCPPETALRVPRGARLRLELHYTPNGTAVKDRSAVGITFAKGPPRYEMLMNSFANMKIAISPHDPHWKEEATYLLPADVQIISFTPHMHWRGKHFFYEVIYPDGKKETLLSVPRWDFNWQSIYRLKDPLRLPKGARLHAVAHWDNSANNPLNPAPEKTVHFGEQSWEEMMVGFVSYVLEAPRTDEAATPRAGDDAAARR